MRRREATLVSAASSRPWSKSVLRLLVFLCEGESISSDCTVNKTRSRRTDLLQGRLENAETKVASRRRIECAKITFKFLFYL